MVLWKLPSGHYINPNRIDYIEQQKVQGISGQLPILVIMSSGSGVKLQGKDAKALLTQMEAEGLLKDISVLKEAI